MLLDGDGFERVLGLSLRGTRPITSRVALDLRIAYDDLAAPESRFAFVAGKRQRARLGIESRSEQHRVRFGYEVESNDRASASVSPERHRLVLNVERRAADDWSVEGALAFRDSDYGDLATPRKERLTEIGAATRRSLAKGWLFGAEYRWSDNDSNIAQFSYQSQRMSLSIGRGF
jgi:hypothetical protein